VLAGVLNLWALDRNGWANTYYSAAVRSMSSSWHNFLYGSFDPSGVMTVDKPPLALWVQALSVKVFGFHSLSILVPQALMGVATVALVYDLTRRLWGRPAGFVAGLVLTLTPITVAISRHNNPDALLALCCAGALWCLVRALQDGRTRWIVLTGVCVGLGFETKMGAALLVVPALAAAWLWFAPRGRVAALRQLLAGGAAMIAVGGAWPLLMALTPASSRPWISGTTDNSILSLILDYNGLGRLDGQLGGPQIMGGGNGGGPGGGGGGGGTFGGASGPLRLLNEALGGQAGWLLGFAVVSLVALAIATRLRRSDPRTGWLIAAGGTFLITAVAFSEAKGIFHPYYVAQLAPFTAALVGAGTAWFLSSRRSAGVLAAAAVVAGVATELVVLHDNPGQLAWLPAVLVGLGAAAAVALVAVRSAKVRAAVVAAALGLLLLAPASWAVQTLGHSTNGTFPAGGPATAGFGGGGGPGGGRGGPGGGFAPGGAGAGQLGGTPPAGATTGGPGAGGMGAMGGMAGGGPFGGDNAGLTAALAYVRQHGGGTIAVSSQQGASTAIITSGAKVAGIGGFSGRESEVDAKWLAEMVRSGRIRWVLTSGSSGFGGNDGRVGSSKVMAAVEQVGKKVTVSSGSSSSTTTLYDLSGTADALAALA
jgi:4-amino-4-deoxy-L-arabinose transferase-like glycosyltransferase